MFWNLWGKPYIYKNFSGKNLTRIHQYLVLLLNYVLDLTESSIFINPDCGTILNSSYSTCLVAEILS